MELDRYNIPYISLITAFLMVLLIGCGGITMKMYGTAEEQYRQAMKEYHKKNYLRAIDGFQKVVFNFSGASMVDSAQYYLGMSQYHLDEYYLAATEFERVVNNYPGSPFVDNAQYMTGLCYFKAAPKHYGLDQAELKRAIQAFEDFIIDYPESELIDDARETMAIALDKLARKRYENGRLYLRLGNYQAAGLYFQTVIDEHTDTDWAARALYYQGEIDFKQEKYEQARNKFKSFLVVYPDHDFSEKAGRMLVKIDKNLAESGENK